MSLHETATLTPAARALLGGTAQYIAGRWEEGTAEAQQAIDPSTGQSLAEVPSACARQVQAAVEAARGAFDQGPWPRLSPADRAHVLMEAARRMADCRQALIDIAVAEGGTPIAQAGPGKVDNTVEHLRWFANKAAAGPDAGWEHALPADPRWPGANSLLVREPVGVVACLTPYNVQYLTSVWKVIGALAAGCTTVFMPAPRAQLAGIAFARVLVQAGLPEGAFNMVLGGATVGKALTEAEGVDLVSFTGSNAVGRQVMTQAAARCKRVVLELGGKSPNIVLPGAFRPDVVSASILRFCRSAGQACGATTRSFVHRADYARYVDAAQAFLRSFRVGDPWDPRTAMGPLIRAEHRASVEAHVERAVAAGGRIEAGGGRPAIPDGFYLHPALVGGVSNDSEIAQEELFGPVGVLIPYQDVDEAVQMANATRFGLNANVWGEDREALAVARQIRSGTVTVNGGGPQRGDVPFGGFKQSGFGSELGDEGFNAFLQVKHIQVSA